MQPGELINLATQEMPSLTSTSAWTVGTRHIQTYIWLSENPSRYIFRHTVLNYAVCL